MTELVKFFHGDFSAKGITNSGTYEDLRCSISITRSDKFTSAKALTPHIDWG